MLWKSVSALILMFWVLMTVLLVRHTYYPDEKGAVAIPVSTVLERAAQNYAVLGGGSTLELLSKGQKSGHATVMITRIEPASKDAKPSYHWDLGGVVITPTDDGSATGVTWRFDGDVDSNNAWQRMHLAARAAHTDTNVTIAWQKGDEMPVIEVRRAGELTMDTKAALGEAQKQAGKGSLGGLATMMPSFLGKQSVSLERLIMMSARSDQIALADRKVRGNVLTLALFGLFQAEARFTEGGSIAEVTLPQGWRLIDTLILGMEVPVAKKP